MTSSRPFTRFSPLWLALVPCVLLADERPVPRINAQDLDNSDQMEIVGDPLVKPQEPPKVVDAREAVPLIDEGNRFCDLGEFERGRDNFLRAIEIDPKNFRGYAGLGRAWIGLNELGRAAEPTQKALELDKNSVDALLNQAEIYFASGQPKNGGDFINKAVNANANFGRLHEVRGAQAYADGKTDEAVQFFESAIKQNSVLGRSYLMLGEAYRQKEKFKEAIATYEKALKIPLSADYKGRLHERLSRLYTSLRQHGLAIKEAKAALFIEKDNADYMMALADAYNAGEQSDKAINTFREAINANPKLTAGYLGMGKTLLKAGHTQRAINTYKILLDLEPQNAQAHYELANAYQKRGDPSLQNAVDHFQRTVALDPDHFDAHFNLGRIYRRDKKYDIARKNLESATRISPKIPAAWEELGYVLTAVGENKKAILAFQKALELDQANPTTRTNLGKVLVADGANDAAIGHFQIVLAKYPRYPEAAYGLGLAFCQKGDVDEAQRYLKKATIYRAKRAGYLLSFINKNCLKGRRPASPSPYTSDPDEKEDNEVIKSAPPPLSNQ